MLLDKHVIYRNWHEKHVHRKYDKAHWSEIFKHDLDVISENTFSFCAAYNLNVIYSLVFFSSISLPNP